MQTWSSARSVITAIPRLPSTFKQSIPRARFLALRRSPASGLTARTILSTFSSLTCWQLWVLTRSLTVTSASRRQVEARISGESSLSFIQQGTRLSAPATHPDEHTSGAPAEADGRFPQLQRQTFAVFR